MTVLRHANLRSLVFLLLGCVLVAPQVFGALRGLDIESLLALVRAGVSEKLIQDQISKTGLAFQPTPASILALKEAGLGRNLLEQIVEVAGLQPSSSAPRQTVRVFERIGADGRRSLIFTNLDEEGNPIRDPVEALRQALEPPAPPPETPPASSCRDESRSLPAAPAAPLVVIHVEAPLPPAPAPAAYPVWTGSIAGPFRYPDRLGFLGYGQGISSPGWFSGLGLKPSNNFGHRKSDDPRPPGFEVFFAPPPGR